METFRDRTSSDTGETLSKYWLLLLLRIDRSLTQRDARLVSENVGHVRSSQRVLQSSYKVPTNVTFYINRRGERVQRKKGIGEVAKIQKRLMALLYLGWPNSSEAEATQVGERVDRRGGRKGGRADDVVATCYQL